MSRIGNHTRLIHTLLYVMASVIETHASIVSQVAPARNLLKTASLERVMDGLSESEKYNAVLQGVSNLVMGKKGGAAAAEVSFKEVFQLLDEMDTNRVKCNPRTASAVVDAATATTSINIITAGAIQPPVQYCKNAGVIKILLHHRVKVN